MKRLLVALALVLLSAGTALAHGVSLRISLGIPLFYTYPVTYGYYHPAPRVIYHDPFVSRVVVKKVFVDGVLVERRVKVFDHGRHDYGSRYHGNYGGYYR
jgi:hypothetical protein